MTRVPRPTVIAAVAALVSAFGFGCQSATSSSGSGSLPIEVIASLDAADQLFPTESAQVIRDAASWNALWAQMNANRGPASPAASVDFTTSMLVVAGMGAQPSSGYFITVSSVTEQDGIVTVDITQTSPGNRCGGLTVITSPITVVRVPMRTGTVLFRRARRVFNC